MNSTLTENLVYTDKISCKKELTISSKAETVIIVFSLLSQNNSFFFITERQLTLFFPRCLYIKEC